MSACYLSIISSFSNQYKRIFWEQTGITTIIDKNRQQNWGFDPVGHDKRLEVYCSYSECSKAVGERIALSVYASLFLAQVQGGDMPPFSSWVEPVATLDLALIVNYLTSSGISFCCFIVLDSGGHCPFLITFSKEARAATDTVLQWRFEMTFAVAHWVCTYFNIYFCPHLVFFPFRIICLNKIVWFSKYFVLYF